MVTAEKHIYLEKETNISQERPLVSSYREGKARSIKRNLGGKRYSKF